MPFTGVNLLFQTCKTPFTGVKVIFQICKMIFTGVKMAMQFCRMIFTPVKMVWEVCYVYPGVSTPGLPVPKTIPSPRDVFPLLLLAFLLFFPFLCKQIQM